VSDNLAMHRELYYQALSSKTKNVFKFLENNLQRF
jgi:hypothetical protein